jgi:predicted PurR-regulated permease PerM
MDAHDETFPAPEPGRVVYPTNWQRRVLWTALVALAITALLGMAALVFLGFITFLSWSYPILLPIGLAVIIALVLEPVVNFVQKRGLSRSTATLFVCLLAIIASMFFWAFLGNTLYTQTSGFFKELPANLNKAATMIQNNLVEKEQPPNSDFPAATENPAQPQTQAPTPSTSGRAAFKEWLTTNLPAIQQEVQKNVANLIYSALGPVGQAFGFLLGFGFVPIYVYYFLADQDRITKHWHEYVPLHRSRLRDEVVSVLTEINTSLVSYFRGQIVVAACNGVLTFIGLWLIGIPYSLVLGVITGALSIVPFLGIIMSILPALLLGFLSSGGLSPWVKPVLVLVVFAVVQMSESMFITPRVQSHSTGLHPLIIILGILFWSLLLPGLLGPVVAVPLTCAAVVLLKRYAWQESQPAADKLSA